MNLTISVWMPCYEQFQSKYTTSGNWCSVVCEMSPTLSFKIMYHIIVLELMYRIELKHQKLMGQRWRLMEDLSHQTWKRNLTALMVFYISQMWGKWETKYTKSMRLIRCSILSWKKNCITSSIHGVDEYLDVQIISCGSIISTLCKTFDFVYQTTPIWLKIVVISLALSYTSSSRLNNWAQIRYITPWRGQTKRL